jgi:hypothetical protein
VSADGHAPGTAGLHLAAGLGLLRPEEQAFTAMLDGWGAQQAARRLSAGTVASRRRAVGAFAAHAEAFPWSWTAQLADEWFTDLRAVRGLRAPALRSYQDAVRHFCAYVTRPGLWVAGAVPVAVRWRNMEPIPAAPAQSVTATRHRKTNTPLSITTGCQYCLSKSAAIKRHQRHRMAFLGTYTICLAERSIRLSCENRSPPGEAPIRD